MPPSVAFGLRYSTYSVLFGPAKTRQIDWSVNSGNRTLDMGWSEASGLESCQALAWNSVARMLALPLNRGKRARQDVRDM